MTSRASKGLNELTTQQHPAWADRWLMMVIYWLPVLIDSGCSLHGVGPQTRSTPNPCPHINAIPKLKFKYNPEKGRTLVKVIFLPTSGWT